MEATVKRVLAAAEDLLKSVQFDENGMMVGGHFQGGNGGMISHETIRKADELRRAIDALKRLTA